MALPIIFGALVALGLNSIFTNFGEKAEETIEKAEKSIPGRLSSLTAEFDENGTLIQVHNTTFNRLKKEAMNEGHTYKTLDQVAKHMSVNDKAKLIDIIFKAATRENMEGDTPWLVDPSTKNTYKMFSNIVSNDIIKAINNKELNVQQWMLESAVNKINDSFYTNLSNRIINEQIVKEYGNNYFELRTILPSYDKNQSATHHDIHVLSRNIKRNA